MEGHQIRNRMLRAIDRAETAAAHPHVQERIEHSIAEPHHSIIRGELSRLRLLISEYDWETNRPMPAHPKQGAD